MAKKGDNQLASQDMKPYDQASINNSNKFNVLNIAKTQVVAFVQAPSKPT